MLGCMGPAQRNSPQLGRILETVRQYWGFDTLRPLQEEAILAGLQRRDSLVVMPTGGGKSLCYHVPPAVVQRTDIVVSPLISLMKDQVDGLRACGYPAAALHSGIAPDQRRSIESGLTAGAYRLVFVAPERLLTGSFLSLLPKGGVGAFVIIGAVLDPLTGLLSAEAQEINVVPERVTTGKLVEEDPAGGPNSFNQAKIVGVLEEIDKVRSRRSGGGRS